MDTSSQLSLIRKVTWIGFWVNAALTALKLLFGIYGRSDALVADGVHSMSDFATDLIVLAFVGIAYKSADSEHPYGHGKFETFASLLIALILLGAGLTLGISGTISAIHALSGRILPRPDAWTIVIAGLSIVLKEILFRYTISAGRKAGSSALIANAWHHRSDAVSSIATLAGVTAAFALGEQWRILDPVAAIIISVFIIVSAIQIALPSVNELLERSLPQAQINEVEKIIASVDGVKAFHRLRTRRNGHSYIFDMHIKVDPLITVTAGHDIATAVEESLRHRFGSDLISSIHVEPYIPHQHTTPNV